MSTVDIMHDRAGYYICWGCLVWVPTIYTITSQYIYFKFKNESSLDTPNALSTGMAALYTIVGVISIFVNYDADNHRAVFRENAGEVNIFGNKAEYIVAKYKLSKWKAENIVAASQWILGHISPLSLLARDHVQYLLVRLRRF